MAEQGGENHPCLELEKGVLPGCDPRCLEHEAQGIGDEKASLWGQDEHRLNAFLRESLSCRPFRCHSYCWLAHVYMNSRLGWAPQLTHVCPPPCPAAPLTRTTGTA